MKSVRIHPRLRLLFSRLSSLLLLFQRSPIIQLIFPEAKLLGGSAVLDTATFAIATVVGLGAFDSVAGATTTLKQLIPTANSATVTSAVNSVINFTVQHTDGTRTPQSYQFTGSSRIPVGLSQSFIVANHVATLSGTVAATEAGTYTITCKAYDKANFTSGEPPGTASFSMYVLGFSTQPAATQSITSGSPVALSCTPTGFPSGATPTYQWYEGTSGTGTLISGATSQTYTPSPPANTNYWVKISSTSVARTVSANSTTAVVTVGAADTTPPTVTINQAVAQADPTSASPINFTVVFSETVTNFATGDVTISGTASGTKTATVTGSGTTYNVAVTGMTSAGTVIASLASGVASDAAGNPSAAATSADGTVTMQTPFASWMGSAGAGMPSNQTGWMDTPQGDGVPNIVKYAFNMDPTKPDARKLRQISASPETWSGLPAGAAVGGTLRLEFIRRKAGANPGITYIPQFCTTLGGWVDAAVTLTPTSIDTTWERVVVNDPSPGPAQRFGRVQINQTP